MKAQIFNEISRYVKLDKDSLFQKGLESLLVEKRRAIMLEQIELLSRYKVSSATELEERIKKGSVEEHPTWEDLIVLENLETELVKIDGFLSDLREAARAS
ncbi:MAG: hypothetical protein U9R04_05020 [Chloroflexota bacterium]|nr:hypothetical protein [Chloroflexota bacterium]